MGVHTLPFPQQRSPQSRASAPRTGPGMDKGSASWILSLRAGPGGGGGVKMAQSKRQRLPLLPQSHSPSLVSPEPTFTLQQPKSALAANQIPLLLGLKPLEDKPLSSRISRTRAATSRAACTAPSRPSPLKTAPPSPSRGRHCPVCTSHPRPVTGDRTSLDPPGPSSANLSALSPSGK